MTDDNGGTVEWVREKIRELNGIERDVVETLSRVDGKGEGTYQHLNNISVSDCNLMISQIQYFIDERKRLEERILPISGLMEANKESLLLNEDDEYPYLLSDAADDVFASPLESYIDYYEELKTAIIRAGDKKQFMDDDQKLFNMKCALKGAGYFKTLQLNASVAFRRIILEYSWRKRKKNVIDEVI